MHSFTYLTLLFYKLLKDSFISYALFKSVKGVQGLSDYERKSTPKSGKNQKLRKNTYYPLFIHQASLSF
jgi:hypothetical protein